MPQSFAPTAAQKALKINLEENIYGSFAEIGAGKETVRHFFRAGGASGTIAKAMSAYDKAFSDAIYGVESDGRYVTLSRLQKMLQHEYALMEERLDNEEQPNRKFFAYANTVATINFTKRFKGHGWMGIRFQSEAGGAPNDVWFHIRMKEEEARLQQETIGDMGVNLIFGAFFKHQDVNELLVSLYDNIHKDKIEIDMIHVDGPAFENVDNRLLSLQLLKHGMTDAVIFGPDGTNILPASLLYKKNILALRGSFRPVTKVNLDMLQKGYEQFTAEKRVDKDRLVVLFEITLHNLKAGGEINDQDFLDRAEVLCSLGHTVLISNYQEYYKLVEYFSRYTKSRMGLIMGLTNLKDIFNDKYYKDLSGGILQAMGVLFSNDLRMYTYPFQPDPNGPVQQIKDLDIHPRLKPLLDYLLNNRRVVDIQDFDKDVLQIFSPKVLGMIKEGKENWEDFLPPYVDEIIKEKELFGYRSPAK